MQAPNSATSRYQHDDLGNLLEEISPDRGTTAYSHDAAGNLISQTDARGITASYSYDALNRLTDISYPTAGENVTLTYDTGTNCTAGLGRLCERQDQGGLVRYAYEAFGNLTRETRLQNG